MLSEQSNRVNKVIARKIEPDKESGEWSQGSMNYWLVVTE